MSQPFAIDAAWSDRDPVSQFPPAAFRAASGRTAVRRIPAAQEKTRAAVLALVARLGSPA